MRYLILILLIASKADGQKYNPNLDFKTKWQYCDFRGKIKSVTTKNYYNIEGDSLLKIWRSFTTDSVTSGIFLSSIDSISFDSTGTLTSLKTGTYFFNNNSVEMFIDGDKKGNPTNDFTNISAPFLDSIKRKISFQDTKRDYVYNKQGKLIRIIGDSSPNSFAAEYLRKQRAVQAIAVRVPHRARCPAYRKPPRSRVLPAGQRGTGRDRPARSARRMFRARCRCRSALRLSLRTRAEVRGRRVRRSAPAPRTCGQGSRRRSVPGFRGNRRCWP